MISSSPTELEGKKLCVYRCLHTIALDIAMQYLLLAIFLLLVNFNLFHPITWVTETISLVFSIDTWVCSIPLILVIILYGIFLGNSYLIVPKYFSSRFKWFWANGPRKILSLFIHCLVGLITAWLYALFLNDQQHQMIIECNNEFCLNNRYMFILFSGVYSGFYFYLCERLAKNPEIKFSIINESKYIRIRSAIYDIVYSSILKSFLPIIFYTILYWLFGSILIMRTINYFNIEFDDSLYTLGSFLVNIRLIFYAWILSSQILSNMYLMDVFYQILLTEPIEFPIEKSLILGTKTLTLVEALSMSKVPIIQQLAALDFFCLANTKVSPRRSKIFELSFPGGHPYNWNQLAEQSLSILNSFTEELTNSLKKISNVKSIEYNVKPTATETVEKILLRQYNETHGIRNIIGKENTKETNTSYYPGNPCKRPTTIDDLKSDFWKNMDDILKGLYKMIPGLFFIFGESDCSKTIYLLAASQNVIWISQALAGLCSYSLSEDQYGVVQTKFANIISSFLKLKLELDKLNNVNLNGKRIDRNYVTLRNSIKRSLYRICTVFSEYVFDVVEDPEENRQLQFFLNYQM